MEDSLISKVKKCIQMTVEVRKIVGFKIPKVWHVEHEEYTTYRECINFKLHDMNPRMRHVNNIQRVTCEPLESMVFKSTPGSPTGASSKCAV